MSATGAVEWRVFEKRADWKHEANKVVRFGEKKEVA